MCLRIAIGDLGQAAKFVVAVTAGHVAYKVDAFIEDQPGTSHFPQGNLELADESVISVTSATPGFLRCQVTFQTPDEKKLQASAGVGFAPLQIKPSLPVPEDFAQFWADQKMQ